MNQSSLEKRLLRIEEDVAFLKRRLRKKEANNGDWIKQMTGSMADNPAFKEAMKLASEIRRSDRPKR